MSAVIVDCAVHVECRPNAMMSRVEMDVCQYFGHQENFLRFGRWAPKTNWTSVLADVVFLAGYWNRDDYRFVPYVKYVHS